MGNGEKLTPEKLKSFAPLGKIPDATLQIYIDDAALEVARFKISGANREKLQRYLAAHYASVSHPRPASRRVSDVSVTYSQGPVREDLDATEYGREYKRLLRLLIRKPLRVL